MFPFGVILSVKTEGGLAGAFALPPIPAHPRFFLRAHGLRPAFEPLFRWPDHCQHRTLYLGLHYRTERLYHERWIFDKRKKRF